MSDIPIGGYLPLHQPDCLAANISSSITLLDYFAQQDKSIYYLNNLTNSLILLLNNLDHISCLHIPEYICPTVSYKLLSHGLHLKTYHIDSSLLLATDYLEHINPGDVVLLVNYFGVLDSAITRLLHEMSNLDIRVIVDSAHSLLSQYDVFAAIYSPRKFLGIPDGGILLVNHSIDVSNLSRNTDVSMAVSALELRLSGQIAEGYKFFLEAEASLASSEVSLMSEISFDIISRTSFASAERLRLDNFNYLHNILGSYNQLSKSVDLTSCVSPLYYPFLIPSGSYLRPILISNNIFTPCFWSSCEHEKLSELEQHLVMNCLLLPIDQRYNLKDMKRMSDFILSLI